MAQVKSSIKTFSAQILGSLCRNVYLCIIISNLKHFTLMWIPCMNCGRMYDESWPWYICDTCGYRICPSCMNSFKCPKCTWGHMKR